MTKVVLRHLFGQLAEELGGLLRQRAPRQRDPHLEVHLGAAVSGRVHEADSAGVGHRFALGR